MRRVRFGRLNKSDAEVFVRLHAAIAAARDTLTQSSWSGRLLVINVLEQCDVVVSELFNRSERAVLASTAPAAEPELVNDQAALTAQVESNGNLDPNAAGQERV